jgi:hypothetical protein
MSHILQWRSADSTYLPPLRANVDANFIYKVSYHNHALVEMVPAMAGGVIKEWCVDNSALNGGMEYAWVERCAFLSQ